MPFSVACHTYFACTAATTHFLSHVFEPSTVLAGGWKLEVDGRIDESSRWSVDHVLDMEIEQLHEIARCVRKPITWWK